MKAKTIDVVSAGLGDGRNVAIDWSQVSYITEHENGTANVFFDYRIGPATLDFRNWLGTGITFEEAVRRWRMFKGEVCSLRIALTKRGWL